MKPLFSPDRLEGSQGKTEEFEFLLLKARGGDSEALRRLLLLYRNYLSLKAMLRIHSERFEPIDPPELVEETLRWAFRHFLDFCGMSERELLCWLEEVLNRKLKNQLEKSTANPFAFPVMGKSADPPSRAQTPENLLKAQAILEERPATCAELLALLPKEHQEILILRHVLRLRWNDISFRLGKPAEAVRMLWVLALEKLQSALEGS